MSDALLATLVLLPVALTYLLKSNAAMGFLALCGGFAAITLSGSDIEQLFGKTKITSLTSNDLDLILLVLPLLLTLLLTFRSVKSHSHRVAQLIPALCAGVLLAIVAGPMFNQVLNTDISTVSIWKNIHSTQSFVVGAGLLTSLLLIWSDGYTSTRSHSKKHK